MPSPKIFIYSIIIKLEVNDTLSVNASGKPLTLVKKVKVKAWRGPKVSRKLSLRFHDNGTGWW